MARRIYGSKHIKGDAKVQLAFARQDGAGFVVVLAGDIMTMPGLPWIPAAILIDIDEDRNITGLS